MYAYIENNTVTETMRNLPKAYTWPDGRKTGNFDSLGSGVQREAGYYPLDDVKPDYDADTQRVVLDGYTINTVDVKANYTVEDIPLAELKLSKSASIEFLLQEKLSSSQFTFAGATFNFTPQTATDAAEFASVLATGFPFPAGFSWTAADGTEVAMDAAMFNLFGQTIAGHKLTLVGTAKAHVAAVNVLTTAQAVAGYDIAAGW